MNRVSIALIALIFTVGCRINSPYEIPEIEAPDGWKNKPPQVEEAPEVEIWWEVFNDPILNDLEEQAVKNNPNLYVALQKVCEAWAVSGVTKSSLYPSLFLYPFYSDSGELFKLQTPPIPGVNQNRSVFRIHSMEYLLPLTARYEVDLWGKLTSQYEASVFTAESQEYAYDATMLTLTSTLATNYFQMRSLEAQTIVLKDSIAAFQKAYDLTKDRFDKGYSPLSDVTQAGLQVTNAEAQYYDTVRQRNLLVDAIAVLTGQPPASFCVDILPLEGCPPSVPVCLPSDVLLRRPDVSQAERQAESEKQLVGAQYASFYPTLNLTSTLGFLSPDLHDFLSWKSRLYELGGYGTQMIFDGDKTVSNVNAEIARFSQASATYQAQILAALQDVEDAMNNLQFQSLQGGSLEKSVEFADKTLKLTQNRYFHGLVSYLEVTTAEQNLLTAQISLINNRQARFVSTVQLIKALGGSW
jgi:multidrug efflux system outer membrane protein